MTCIYLCESEFVDLNKDKSNATRILFVSLEKHIADVIFVCFLFLFSYLPRLSHHHNIINLEKHSAHLSCKSEGTGGHKERLNHVLLEDVGDFALKQKK